MFACGLGRHDIRWYEFVKGQQEGCQPDKCIDSLDRVFLHREQQWEEADMARDC